MSSTTLSASSFAPAPPFVKASGKRRRRSMFRAIIREPLQVRVRVARKAINRSNRRHSKISQVVEVSPQIRQPALQVAFALIPNALHGRYEYRRRGSDTGLSHHNIEIFFHRQDQPQIPLRSRHSRPAGAPFLARSRCSSRARYFQTVGVHKRGCAVGRLHQIWQNGVREQRHHSACRL